MITGKFRSLLQFSALAVTNLFFANSLEAQSTQPADKIIAVVGKSRIVLKSELENQLMHAKAENPALFTDSSKCTLLMEMMFQKILVEQAERDSVYVSDDEVDGTMDNRLRFYIQNAGSKERLEQMMGKTIYQMKEENREVIREQMTADRMKNQLLSNIKITPAEVKRFFDKIPADSLPYFPATVEIGQIVVDPPVSGEMDLQARTKLEEIRKAIVSEGKDFETYATMYSADPGSRDNGGDLGSVSRTDVVPEFATAAFKLQNGEVSQIVKTKFGYHIIQMIQRQGEQAHLRHILIRPERTSGDYKKALSKLDSVRAELVSGKVSFQIAVGKYSTDEASKTTGGMITNPRTNSSRLEIDELDPSLVMLLDSLQPGAYSNPHMFTDPQTGERSCRIVYIKGRTQPHKANLQDDYNKIQDVALQQKKTDKLNSWLAEKLPSYFIKIDPEYQSCSELAPWVAAMKR